MVKGSGASEDAAYKSVGGIKPKTSKQGSAEERIGIVRAVRRGKESIAALCRGIGVAGA